jgi:DNA-binding NtrC family response regulator
MVSNVSGKQMTDMANILFIEDDEELLQQAKEYFELNDMTVFTAINGRDGLRILCENPIDVMITDIIMPEKEGLETIYESKRLLPDLPIIAISGGGTNLPDGYLAAARRFGAHSIFKKPIRLEDLLQNVKDFFN